MRCNIHGRAQRTVLPSAIVAAVPSATSALCACRLGKRLISCGCFVSVCNCIRQQYVSCSQ